MIMKRLTVTINGVVYDVTVEEKSGDSAPIATQPAVAPAPVATAAPATPAPAAAPAGGKVQVNAPMPGTVLKVNVADTVNADYVVIILEAMKMENEIFAPASGKVIAINTTKGASVNSGDCLLVIG